MRAIRVGVAAAVATVALGWAGACTAAYVRAFRPRRWGDDAGRGWTPLDIAADHHLLRVTTQDGVPLLAWYLPGQLPATVVISGGNRGRTGDVLGIGGALWRAGFGVVAYGWRGTPGSGVAPHTLGVHERRDLTAVIDAVTAELGPQPIGLLGFSLGAAVSIMVAADDPRVKAVCADSGFAAATDVLGEGVERVLRIPGQVVVAPLAATLRWRTGARLEEMRPVDVVARLAPRPLLLIHGGRDASVGVANARRLYAAAGEPRELWVVESAVHVGAYFEDRARYVDKVTRFFEAALLSGAGSPPIPALATTDRQA
jgi:dipeptidyl aminopeptidase/acylaminoacyl peptidase